MNDLCSDLSTLPWLCDQSLLLDHIQTFTMAIYAALYSRALPAL